MAKTIVIGDLHGRADLLVKALIAIQFRDLVKDENTIVVLGDFVDRGPDSHKCIGILRSFLAGTGGPNFVVLKGNHEDYLVAAKRKKIELGDWLKHGFWQTLISFGHDANAPVSLDAIPGDVVQWLDSLPLYYEDKHRVYVHAGVDQFFPLNGQNPETLLWKIYRKDDPGGFGSKHVVHGHVALKDGPKHYAGRSNYDTSAWNTGRLVIGIFDDDVPGGPVEELEIQGLPMMVDIEAMITAREVKRQGLFDERANAVAKGRGDVVTIREIDKQLLAVEGELSPLIQVRSLAMREAKGGEAGSS